jgi:hypothetical protein
MGNVWKGMILPKKGFTDRTGEAEKKGGFSMVGDAGFEPTAFDSGDQRSIHLS